MKTCQADQCERAVSQGFPLCRNHWFGLPGELRQKLSRAMMQGDTTNQKLYLGDARSWLRENRT